MAAATAKAIRLRLQAVLAESELVDTLLTSQDCPIRDDQLPAYMVTARAATRSRSAADVRTVTRQFEILVLHASLIRVEAEHQVEAIDAVNDVIDDLPDHLMAVHPRLEVERKPMDGIERIGDPTDDGPQIIVWNGNPYAGVVYTVPVTIKRLGRKG